MALDDQLESGSWRPVESRALVMEWHESEVCSGQGVVRAVRFLIFSLILVSCTSNVSDHPSQEGDSPPGAQELLGEISEFAEAVLGDRLRVHYTEHKRGDLGVDALFESEELIGYTTFSNDLYQKVSSPVDLKDCILFAANYESQESAASAFEHLKSSSVIRASEVEGMVGVTPVQVRFLERIRNDGGGGVFTQQGSYVFFLTENGEAPPIAENWKDYENLFLASIAGDDASMETIEIRR